MVHSYNLFVSVVVVALLPLLISLRHMNRDLEEENRLAREELDRKLGR